MCWCHWSLLHQSKSNVFFVRLGIKARWIILVCRPFVIRCIDYRKNWCSCSNRRTRSNQHCDSCEKCTDGWITYSVDGRCCCYDFERWGLFLRFIRAGNTKNRKKKLIDFKFEFTYVSQFKFELSIHYLRLISTNNTRVFRHHRSIFNVWDASCQSISITCC